MNKLFTSPLALALYFIFLLQHVPFGISQNYPFTLRLLPNSTATEFGAACLDGSVPGYYYKPAPNPASRNKWKIHFRGGGWCNNPESCYSRVATSGGSSLYYDPNIYNTTNAPFGFMDDNSTNAFGDWTAVWVPYCDGSSWSSRRTDPIVYNNTNIYLRGYNNLLAILSDLEVQGNFLSQATEVIITGTSAGGMTTAIFTQYIKQRLLQSQTFVIALMDAGWWWNALDIHNKTSFGDSFQEAYDTNFWNTTDGNTLLPACVASTPRALQWQCMLPDYIYLDTYKNVDGVFVMQSLYDSAQLGMELGLPCDPFTTCNNSQLQQMQTYRTIFEQRILTGQANYPERDGHFMTACYQHEESCRDRDWYGIEIMDNSTQITYTANQVFTAWYYTLYNNTPTTVPTKLIDGTWPNNPSCASQDFHHGGC